MTKYLWGLFIVLCILSFSHKKRERYIEGTLFDSKMLGDTSRGGVIVVLQDHKNIGAMCDFHGHYRFTIPDSIREKEVVICCISGGGINCRKKIAVKNLPLKLDIMMYGSWGTVNDLEKPPIRTSDECDCRETLIK
jgi:hypothetical protein